MEKEILIALMKINIFILVESVAFALDGYKYLSGDLWNYLFYLSFLNN
jgi:hypothetical protein